jgi:hypothetical protein
VEELWAAMVACWPKNLRIIIRYLFIVSGMAPSELIEYVRFYFKCCNQEILKWEVSLYH